MTKIMIMVLVKIMSDDKKENFSSLPKGAAVDCRDWPTNLDAKNHCPTDFDVKTNHHPCPTPLLKNDRGWELDCTALIYWHVWTNYCRGWKSSGHETDRWIDQGRHVALLFFFRNLGSPKFDHGWLEISCIHVLHLHKLLYILGTKWKENPT